MSREQALAAPSTGFAPDAIEIHVRADAGLNCADGQAHTVVVGLFQGAQGDALRELVTQPPRVETALVDGRPPPGVLQLTRFVVQPGQSCLLRQDRVQKTLAVALAVGYAQRDASPPLRVFDIPLQLKSRGWLSRSYTASAAPLRLQLKLGPDDILDAAPLPQASSKPPTAPAARPAPPVAPCQRLPPT